jgi:SAM-dependent methyltransferase
MAENPTREHRSVWQTKPVLKHIYGDYYRRILDNCVPGRILEIGGGSGNFKALHREVVSIDVQNLPWLDAVADAHHLPFSDGSMANVVMVDVLHHLAQPPVFLRECIRVLAPGGRLVIVEPAITPISSLVYTHLHPEPVDMSQNPLQEGLALSTDEPFSSNQAIPTLLFERHRADLESQFPRLRVVRVERFSPFSYLLSGGFRPWSLLPARIAPAVLRLESAIEPLVSGVVAFRLMAVVERA